MYVHCSKLASSSASGVAAPSLGVDEDDGTSVMVSVREADFNCDGAVLWRACSMPCVVRLEVNSAPVGGVMAIGGMFAVGTSVRQRSDGEDWTEKI